MLEQLWGLVLLVLLYGGLNGCGLFGRNCGAATAAEVAISSNEQYLERKECEDMVALTNAMWQHVYNEQGQRFNDRQVINQEMFGIYSAMRSGFDVINAKHNQDAFDLYKYSRDSKDELAGEIGALRTEVAVLKATRPFAQVKKYPEVLGGVEIGNGKVRMNIPVINKVVEFDTDDIKTLKETLITK